MRTVAARHHQQAEAKLLPVHCPGCKRVGKRRPFLLALDATGLPEHQTRGRCPKIVQPNDKRYGSITQTEFTPEFYKNHVEMCGMSLRDVALYHGKSAATFTRYMRLNGIATVRTTRAAAAAKASAKAAAKATAKAAAKAAAEAAAEAAAAVEVAAAAAAMIELSARAKL